MITPRFRCAFTSDPISSPRTMSTFFVSLSSLMERLFATDHSLDSDEECCMQHIEGTRGVPLAATQ